MVELDEIAEEYNYVMHKYNHLPVVENIESYIATFFWWFDDEIINRRDESIYSREIKSVFNQAKKRSILNYKFDINKNKGFFSPFRQIETEYDENKGIIFLNSDEEDFLNQGYFEKQIDERFKDVIDSINNFYSKYKETNGHTLLKYLKMTPSHQTNLYVNEPSINYKNLTIDLFKDITSRKWKELNDNLEEKISYLGNKYSNENVSLLFDSHEEQVRKNINGGLVLMESYNMTDKKAKRFCKWLKQAGYIAEGTNYVTLKNIFVKKISNIGTKIVWVGYNHELKYFINQLHQKKIIKSSGHQKKWSDVIACFLDRNGCKFDNKSFSKNLETPSDESEKSIDSIVSRLKGEFTG